MFSAVSNLGAGGTQNLTLSDTANGVLYGMFALTGLISGGIANSTSFRHLVCFFILAAVRCKFRSVLVTAPACYSQGLSPRQAFSMPVMQDMIRYFAVQFHRRHPVGIWAFSSDAQGALHVTASGTDFPNLSGWAEGLQAEQCITMQPCCSVQSSVQRLPILRAK